jgi:hypothetical protein
VRNRKGKIMEDLTKKPMQKHPSYGYATPRQIELLKTLPIGPERSKILKDIEEQTRKKRKKK